SAARTFVATASETSGPPSIPSTQSRTIEKAGSAAITAPNPTRLATLRAGRTEALAPASILCRTEESFPRWHSITVAIATTSATTTDHTQASPEIEVAPQRSSARNEKSSRGSTTSDIKRFTTTTTTSGSAANNAGGAEALRSP